MLDFTDGAETSFAPSPPASARILLPSVCAHFLQHKHFVYIAHLKVLSPPGVKHYSVAKASPLLHTFTGIITIPVKIGSHRPALKTRRITRPSKIYEKETMDRETRNGDIARLNRAHRYVGIDFLITVPLFSK